MKIYLRQSIHSSWMISVVCAGIVIGVITSTHVLVVFSAVMWLVCGCIFVVMALRRPIVGYVLFALIGGVVIGLWRGSIALGDRIPYERVMNSVATIQGTVKEDAERNKRGQTVLRVATTTINGSRASGTVWITSTTNILVRRSDIVTVRANVSPGFGSFNAALYSASLVAVQPANPPDIALQVRDWFAYGVQQAITEPQASLGLGYLVGQRRGLPEELDMALVAAGLTHIVVASGYNLTILVRIARRLFERISKYLSFIVTSAMIVSFIGITGMSPSMSRAGLVAGLSLLAWYYGRKFHPLVLLLFAMAVTLLVEPTYARGDIGWQLSFAAFAGVMIVAPLLQAYFFADKKEKVLRRILIETVAAQLCTLPILLVAFGQFSVVAPIANILILPLVPLAMLLTFISGLGGIFVPEAADVIGLPATLLLTYMTETAEYMGALPWAVQSAAITPVVAVAMFMTIIGSCWYMARRTKLALENTSLIE